jgi:hypothetical protein
VDESSRPVLFVVIDTEEEFDWSADFSRAHVSVQSVKQLGRVDKIFAPFGVRPSLVIDYPIASQDRACRAIRERLESNVCTVGAHLHPWVNPPFRELVSTCNSFGCNLPSDLEQQKIAVLKDVIADRLHVEPRMFKAGRYGLGPSTVSALLALGFRVDLSINTQIDYRREGGPSFLGFEARPCFLDEGRRLLEIPCTTGYSGLAAGWGESLHALASLSSVRRLRLVGALARARILEKSMLSPEGHTYAEMRRLTYSLLGQGVRTFALTFHSPSLEPGHTPYVRTGEDLRQFLARVEDYLEFFFGELGGTTMTPEEFGLAMAVWERDTDPLPASAVGGPR